MEVIETGPRDNRGVILSVSIKYLQEQSKGRLTCLEAGQKLPTGEQEGLIITSRVSLK